MKHNENKRCRWVEHGPQIYLDYHDHEWGVAIYDEHTLIEMLILESFQAGLSWLIILKKREAFRIAFDHFDINKIAQYDEEKVSFLLANKEIIRSKLKIRSTILNAQKILEIQAEYGSFSNYIWKFSKHEIVRGNGIDFPTTSSLSDEIAKDMKKRGMKFLGSVTVYSYLQAVGIVDDHDATCFKFHKTQ